MWFISKDFGFGGRKGRIGDWLEKSQLFLQRRGFNSEVGYKKLGFLTDLCFWDYGDEHRREACCWFSQQK